jgi:hypothetical protein
LTVRPIIPGTELIPIASLPALYNPRDLALIRRTVALDTTDDEFALFIRTRIEDRHGRKFRHKAIRALDARGNGFGGLIARVARLRYNASRARFLHERQPDGVLDRKALRGGKPLGEVFGFLSEINHGHNLAQSAVNA